MRLLFLSTINSNNNWGIKMPLLLSFSGSKIFKITGDITLILTVLGGRGLNSKISYVTVGS